jgi:hypothetical protein
MLAGSLSSGSDSAAAVIATSPRLDAVESEHRRTNRYFTDGLPSRPKRAVAFLQVVS